MLLPQVRRCDFWDLQGIVPMHGLLLERTSAALSEYGSKDALIPINQIPIRRSNHGRLKEKSKGNRLIFPNDLGSYMSKETVEGYRWLDVREMWRQGHLMPGIIGTMSWTR